VAQIRILRRSTLNSPKTLKGSPITSLNLPKTLKASPLSNRGVRSTPGVANNHRTIDPERVAHHLPKLPSPLRGKATALSNSPPRASGPLNSPPILGEGWPQAGVGSLIARQSCARPFHGRCNHQQSNSVPGLFKHGIITSIAGYAGCQPAKHQQLKPKNLLYPVVPSYVQIQSPRPRLRPVL